MLQKQEILDESIENVTSHWSAEMRELTDKQSLGGCRGFVPCWQAQYSRYAAFTAAVPVGRCVERLGAAVGRERAQGGHVDGSAGDQHVVDGRRDGRAHFAV